MCHSYRRRKVNKIVYTNTNTNLDLINAQVLSECKKGVRIVNCARGGIINEKDIVDAMNNGKCAGAGFDVFEEVWTQYNR